MDNGLALWNGRRRKKKGGMEQAAAHGAWLLKNSDAIPFEVAMIGGTAAYSLGASSMHEIMTVIWREYRRHTDPPRTPIHLASHVSLPASGDPRPTIAETLSRYKTNWSIAKTKPNGEADEFPGAFIATESGFFFMDMHEACIFKLHNSSPESGDTPKVIPRVSNYLGDMLTGFKDSSGRSAQNQELLNKTQLLTLLNLMMRDLELLVRSELLPHSSLVNLVQTLVNGTATTNKSASVDASDLFKNITPKSSKAINEHMLNQITSASLGESVGFMGYDSYKVFINDKKQQKRVLYTMRSNILTYNAPNSSVVLFAYPCQTTRISRCPGAWAPLLELRYTFTAADD